MFPAALSPFQLNFQLFLEAPFFGFFVVLQFKTEGFRQSDLDILSAPVSGGTPTFVVSTENRGSSRRMPRPFTLA